MDKFQNICQKEEMRIPLSLRMLFVASFCTEKKSRKADILKLAASQPLTSSNFVCVYKKFDDSKAKFEHLYQPSEMNRKSYKCTKTNYYKFDFIF